ncbi:MAG: phosphonate C-P lyase system protein PhnL [Alphaproteobacteria bacterium]|nr:phosphonate C-P lyase system protein PhnL [Alphaproteobacteria bacterium]
MTTSSIMLDVSGLSKSFVLHTQGSARIAVFDNLSLQVHAGECVALDGPSGAGKSTLMRMLYANYRTDTGAVRVHHRGTMVDLATAPPRTVIDVRRRTLGYVSQFLRVIPRVSTLDVVAEPLRALGTAGEEADERARGMLQRLNVPERLWDLAPATFSGGEQQRVNVARGFVAELPVLLLDEPTASLDAINRQCVVDLIGEAKSRGAAIVGIFHDRRVRDDVADRVFDMSETLAAGGAAA